MPLEIIIRLAFVIIAALALGVIVIVGTDRIPRDRITWRNRLIEVVPEVALLGGILLLNNYARQHGPHVSWVIGWEVTDTIYQIEGNFVVWLQDLATPLATMYFSRIYVYGYVFLLVFPLIAYLVLDDTRPLRTLLLAYGLNYLIGLIIYIAVIAYGPRNLLPDLIDPLMYTAFPEYQELTRQVNRRVNVFPSLHTSLSVTVALVAYRTRSTYPYWLGLSSILAISVMISTMYLGIHWALDVVAGVILAVVAVTLAAFVVNRWGGETFLPQSVYQRLSA